eukprot:Hpha_TRINITY_DN14663_c0_g1::TRINITY_DN14663_c0_g1_i4::g.47922::m.47922
MTKGSVLWYAAIDVVVCEHYMREPRRFDEVATKLAVLRHLATIGGVRYLFEGEKEHRYAQGKRSARFTAYVERAQVPLLLAASGEDAVFMHAQEQPNYDPDPDYCVIWLPPGVNNMQTAKMVSEDIKVEGIALSRTEALGIRVPTAHRVCVLHKVLKLAWDSLDSEANAGSPQPFPLPDPEDVDSDRFGDIAEPKDAYRPVMEVQQESEENAVVLSPREVSNGVFSASYHPRCPLSDLRDYLHETLPPISASPREGTSDAVCALSSQNSHSPPAVSLRWFPLPSSSPSGEREVGSPRGQADVRRQATPSRQSDGHRTRGSPPLEDGQAMEQSHVLHETTRDRVQEVGCWRSPLAERDATIARSERQLQLFLTEGESGSEATDSTVDGMQESGSEATDSTVDGMQE